MLEDVCVRVIRQRSELDRAIHYVINSLFVQSFDLICEGLVDYEIDTYLVSLVVCKLNGSQHIVEPVLLTPEDLYRSFFAFRLNGHYN